MATTEFSTPKVLLEAVGRLIRLLVWYRKEKMQAQGLAAPEPPLGKEGLLRGRA